MNIIVLLKQTFDTEEKLSVANGRISSDGVKFIINPYDEYALEEAIRLKEQLGEGLIVAVSAGSERNTEALRTALAMGADEAILLEADSIADDEHALSVAMSCLIASMNFDLILGGLFSVDRGAGQLAMRLAERLKLPHAGAAVRLQLLESGGGSSNGTRRVLVHRDAEGDTEVLELPLPAVITAQQGLNEPRYPSLPGIMKAKRKPLRRITLDELQLVDDDTGECDEAPAPASFVRTERVSLYTPAPRSTGKLLTGTPAEQVAALVKLLRDETKLL